MEANECRLNNIVDYRGETTVLTQNEMVHFYRFSEEYKPILLTEEWLLKFGFEVGDVFNFENEICKISITYYDGWHFNYKEKEGFGDSEIYLYPTNINHVHQLQNLYFALTGEELTIKEL